MTEVVEVPLWLFVLIVVFAAVTFASHFLFPSVRWYLRRRLEKAVARLNERLERPIEPFKLARRQDMIQRLIYDPQVTQAIVDDARKRGEREDVAFERARRYAREIVPSFSAFAYFGFGIRIARWFATALYDVRTGEKNQQALERVPSDATVVFIMNHRSNMDYVLVTYLAARASALSYAVGEWARVWPLSRLIKSMGAYFIRRKSRGALYRKVLARYVQMATAGGVTQAIFPEGGLSLDGNLMPPKMGLLAYVASDWQPGMRDVAFVPVAINYDRVLEDRVLVSASKTGQRRFGVRITVVMGFVRKKLWERMRGRFRSFGQAGVVFGEPVLLSDHAHLSVESLAERLMQHIAGQMPVLPVPLLARVMSDAGGQMEEAAIEDTVSEYLNKLAPRPPAGMMDDLASCLQSSLEQMIARQLLQRVGRIIKTNPETADVLSYYANSLSGYAHRRTDMGAQNSADAKL